LLLKIIIILFVDFVNKVKYDLFLFVDKISFACFW